MNTEIMNNEEEEKDCCFKCGNTGVFGETHFYAQPEKDGEENLYCNDCDVKSWYDVCLPVPKLEITTPKRFTITNIGKHIVYNPEDDFYTGEDGILCAQFTWDYENDKIDKIASKEFTNAFGDKKKNLMWVEKFKEVANWKKGEYIYAFTKTNADGYYNVHYKKDKVKFSWFNMIVEPSGYVAMKTYNHYTLEQDDDIKSSMFVRVESIYNDKNTK
jgi:hypothetical protein